MHVSHTLQAVILLGEVQQSRRVSSGLRLAGASLYSILGAPLQVHKELSFLEIKHIQHDTLSGEMQTLPWQLQDLLFCQR